MKRNYASKIYKINWKQDFPGISPLCPPHPGLRASGFISLPQRKKKKKKKTVGGGGWGGWWPKHMCFQWSPFKTYTAGAPKVELVLLPEPTPPFQVEIPDSERSWGSHFALRPSFYLTERVVRLPKEVTEENTVQSTVTMALTFSRSFLVLELQSPLIPTKLSMIVILIVPLYRWENWILLRFDLLMSKSH